MRPLSGAFQPGDGGEPSVVDTIEILRACASVK